MIIDLVRHADAGRRGYLDGRTDSLLLDDATAAVCGRHQGIAWSQAVTSPLRRAHDTAAALVAAQDLPIALDPRWAELDFGDWDGQLATALPKQALAVFYADPQANPPPGGESRAQLAQRVRAALENLCQTDQAGPVLVVSHGGPLRMALSIVCGLPLEALWALRIDYGTRLRLDVRQDERVGLWGELLELVQP